MIKVEVIGNIGADAEVKESNGSKFISFRVADTQRYTGQDGTEHSETTWIDCTINNAEAKVLPYLKQGVKVFVRGNLRARVYSSKKDRCMKAGLTVMAQEVELCGGSADLVPRQLVIPESGQLVDTNKLFWVNLTEEQAKLNKSAQLVDTRGKLYERDTNGFVTPVQEQGASEMEQEQQ